MKYLVYILFTFLFISCSTPSLTNKTKRLELGISKKKVISIMGKDYRFVSSSKTKDGDLEIISYGSTSENTYYHFFLLDGKLIKWQEKQTSIKNHSSSHRRR